MPFTAPGFACDLDEAEDLAELRRTGALDAFFQ
jgi:2-phospho-L-lactate guanylyltransferase (CobY/MobA/RfbA family)